MTRLSCPGCGTGVDATSGVREHECARCGTSFSLSADDHGFAVLVSEDRAGVRVVVSGEVDLVTASVLQRHLSAAMTRGRDLVEVDLSKVTFLDVRGVNALISARNELAGSGARLALGTPSAAVRRTLRLCGLESLAPA